MHQSMRVRRAAKKSTCSEQSHQVIYARVMIDAAVVRTQSVISSKSAVILVMFTSRRKNDFSLFCGCIADVHWSALALLSVGSTGANPSVCTVRPSVRPFFTSVDTTRYHRTIRVIVVISLVVVSG